MLRRTLLLAPAVALGLALGALPAPADDAAPEATPAPQAKPAPKAKPTPAPRGTDWLGAVPWRSIGPANMGGRITSVAVSQQDPSTWFAATASGGLLKTTNNGSRFEHQFDGQATVSIGDVAVAPSNHDIVWVGTGEANPRNSVSWGDGVYKSVDGGKTWAHMGLKGAFQTGAVRIHPTDPETVYVGALGRLWGDNEERGLFKTTDGGKTWAKILYVDARTGVIDMQFDPRNPDVFLVATYERQRDGLDTNDPALKFGAGSGLWRTEDGGATFERITKGLPTCKLGRMGLDWAASEEGVVFLVLESERIGTTPPDSPYIGISGENADAGGRLVRVVKDGPAAKAGLQVGDVVIAVAGERIIDYAGFIKAVRQHKAGETLALGIVRKGKEEAVELTLGTWPKPRQANPNPDIGRRGPFAAFLGGQRQDLQDQQGKDGHEYGGIYRSDDSGRSWTRVNSLNPRPMYFSEIRVDPTDAKRLWVLGIRLWKSEDGGATFTNDGHDGTVHVDHHALWIDPKDPRHMILGNDGGVYVTWDRGKTWDHHNTVAIGQFYHVGVDATHAYRVYGGLQDNGSWGGPSRVRDARGPRNEDFFRVGGGDGFRCLVDPLDPERIYFASQNGGVGRRHLGTGERGSVRPRAPRGTSYRFNWNTPYVLSHHNSRIYYMAGNRVFRSLDRGNSAKVISPEIAHTKRGSASALAESPRDPDLLYVGTDDGALWASRDGGHTWEDLFAPPPAAPSKAAKGDTQAPVTEGAGGDGDEGDDKPEPAETPAAPSAKDAAPEGAAPGDAPASDKGEAQAATEPQVSDLPPFQQYLFQRDENKDGLLQMEELPEHMRERAKAADKDKDGALSVAEMLAGFRREASSGDASKADAPRRGARRRARTPKGVPLATLVPERRWVSWIEPSRHTTGRVYLVLDGHRSDDDRAHLYASEDAGRTWRSIRGDLPAAAGTTRVLVEDLQNPDLLYLGTEFGAWATLDRGAHWVELGKGLPTVAVHALAQHPTTGEIVAGTHGRSLWVVDVTPLRQMRPKTLEADVVLFRPGRGVLWRPQPGRGAARGFTGQNPVNGIVLSYALGSAVEGGVKLRIERVDGRVVRTLEGKGEAGFHQVTWDLRQERRRGNRPPRVAGRVQRGSYKAVLVIGDDTWSVPIQVEMDPDHPDPTWIAGETWAEEDEALHAGQDKDQLGPWLGDD